MDKINIVLQKMLDEKYYTKNEILYGTEIGQNLSPYEYSQLLSLKKDQLSIDGSRLIKLDLLDYKNGNIFFGINNELFYLIQNLSEILKEDVKTNNALLIERKFNEIMQSRLYSEIEGTLNVENVHSSRKRISELANNKLSPENKNDRIILNMYKAMEFLLDETPEFNSENLYKLYNLLSDGCLEKDYQLKSGNLYRDDAEEVDGYECCPFEKIEECMNSLFEFVNAVINKNNKTNLDLLIYDLLPHIAHYYILYVHPYFDYNGRTARTVSLWITLLIDSAFPIFLSEAIDATKNKYYSSLRNTRNSENDLTYFLIYIYKTANGYYNCYKNLENIEEIAKQKGHILTETEKAYIKKILISSHGKFTYADFVVWIKSDISKQGAFKFLNQFVNYGVLNTSDGKSNSKLFELNKNVVIFNTKLSE